MTSDAHTLPSRALTCTVCGEEVDVCSICLLGFLPDLPVACRRAAGHAHAGCAAEQVRKAASSSPPGPPGPPGPQTPATNATEPPMSGARPARKPRE